MTTPKGAKNILTNGFLVLVASHPQQTCTRRGKIPLSFFSDHLSFLSEHKHGAR